jgi:hypothetical protein
MSKSHRNKHWPDNWGFAADVPGGVHVPSGPEFKALAEWMEAMVEWGQEVRDDINRLESGLGIGAGDPGDPPPSPWKKT